MQYQILPIQDMPLLVILFHAVSYLTYPGTKAGVVLQKPVPVRG